MQEKTTPKTIPPFGFISGLATTACFLFPAIALGALIFFGLDAKFSTSFFIILTLIVRFTGDWVFWTQMVPHELNLKKPSTNWSALIKKDALLSQPDVNKSILDTIIDFASDILLICIALKTSISPAWICFIFLGCQAIATPIQGIFIYQFNTKKYRKFSMFITALAVLVTLGIKNGGTLGFYVHLFRLDYFTVPTQILIMFCAKNLLSGIPVISKATIAEHLQNP